MEMLWKNENHIYSPIVSQSFQYEVCTIIFNYYDPVILYMK